MNKTSPISKVVMDRKDVANRDRDARPITWPTLAHLDEFHLSFLVSHLLPGLEPVALHNASARLHQLTLCYSDSNVKQIIISNLPRYAQFIPNTECLSICDGQLTKPRVGCRLIYPWVLTE